MIEYIGLGRSKLYCGLSTTSNYRDERYVQAAVIGALLESGFPNHAIGYEFTLGPGSRCDVVAFSGNKVFVIECKVDERVARDGRAIRQALRYAEDARARWPNCEIVTTLAFGVRVPALTADDLRMLAVE